MTYLTGTAPYTNLANQTLAQVALSSTTDGLQTLAMSDLLGRQMVQGAAAVNSSSYGIYPFLVAGVNAYGLIQPVVVTADGLKCDTELTLEASSVTVGNVKTWANSAGTQYFGLCDSSQRPILSNTSTVQAIIFGNASTAGLVIAGGTIGVETEFATGSTFSIYPFTTSTVGVSIPTTSTVQISGALSTTSTVPVSFATTSTVGAAISGTISEVTSIAYIAGQSSTLGLVVAGGTIAVETEFAVGSTFSIYPFTTSTVGVSIPTTSTLGAAVSWAATSTLDVRFATTSTLGVAISGALSTTSTVPVSFDATSTIGVSWAQDTTSTVPVSFLATSTIGAAISGALSTTSTVPISFVATSTLGAAVSWATGSTVNVSFSTTSTIGVAISGALSTTSTVPVSFSTTSTLGAAVTMQSANTATEIRAQVVASTQLVAANSSRVAAVIQNVSTIDAFLGFGASASTLGYKITQDAAYEINQTNLYTGAISVISESATGTADIRLVVW